MSLSANNSYLWYNSIVRKEGMTQRHIIIGDVHGMSEELSALLADVQPTNEDTVVFVGDLVDKGPDSAGVVRMVREMAETASFEVIVVEGNHEEKHRRFRRNMVVRPEVAHEQAKNDKELAEITELLSPKDVAFLESSVTFYRIPDHDAIIVHGGIPGNMKSFPPDIDESQMSASQRKKLGLDRVQRTRYISAKTGSPIHVDNQTPADPFWANVYDGRFGHIIFGHQPFMTGVKEFPFATGIDTGAVHGGKLTAMIIKSSGERSFASVPSRLMAKPFQHRI